LIKEHPKAIIQAIYAGDYSKVESYVTKENVNWRDKYGDTLLVIAATDPEVKMRIVTLLIKRGADVNIRVRGNYTLLHCAAHLLNKDLVRELLIAGCDPNSKTDAGETPLYKTLWAHDPKKDIIKLLLEHGADLNLPTVGDETAVSVAARTGQMNLLPKEYIE
jgi:ankyrin repeat protein